MGVTCIPFSNSHNNDCIIRLALLHFAMVSVATLYMMMMIGVVVLVKAHTPSTITPKVHNFKIRNLYVDIGYHVTVCQSLAN